MKFLQLTNQPRLLNFPHSLQSVLFLLPDVWLFLSLHELVYKTLLLLNHRPPFIGHNEVLCLVSFWIRQQWYVYISTYSSLQRLFVCTQYIIADGSKPSHNSQQFWLCSLWYGKAQWALQMGYTDQIKATKKQAYFWSLLANFKRLLLWNHGHFSSQLFIIHSVSVTPRFNSSSKGSWVLTGVESHYHLNTTHSSLISLAHICGAQSILNGCSPDLNLALNWVQ